jgi:hypothetical protein
MPTYGFPVDGRTTEEVARMKASGYGEEEEFMELRKGFLCYTCGAFKPIPFSIPKNPSRHDGYCMKLGFRDRSGGCCAGWYAKE